MGRTRMGSGRRLVLSLAVGALGAGALVSVPATVAGAAGGNVGPIDFESGYTNGSIYGQNGWGGSDGCGTKDQAVVANAGFPGGATFGTKSFRLSNAVTGGCFTDPTTPSAANEAGQADAINNGHSGGTRQSTFEAQFTIASSTGALQPGLFSSFSPDRGDGARMSYVSATHDATDLELVFYDVQGVDPPQATPCTSCANFVPTSLGHYDPTVPHTIKFKMQFVDGGPNNDIVEIYVDGVLKHTGGSWEDYFTLDTESSPTPELRFPRTVDSLLFRASGTAVPANAGQGFLYDNIIVSTVPICTTTCFVAPGGSGTQSGIDAANAMPSIQMGVDTVEAGGTVNVAAGTYDEHVTIAKKLDLVGAGSAATIIDPSTDGSAINITSGGSSAADADRLKVRNLRTTGTTPLNNSTLGSGITLTGAGPISYVTLDGVDSVANATHGVYISTSGTVTDLVINNSNLSNNGSPVVPVPHYVGDGLLISSGVHTVDGLTITNSHLDNNVFGGWETYLNTATTAASDKHLKNVLVQDTTFDGNGYKGIYLERLKDAVLQRVSSVGSGTVVDSSFTFPAGIDINLKYQNYANISILDSTITGNGNVGGPSQVLNSSGLTIKARGTGNDPSYAANPATLNNVIVRGNTIGTNVAAGIRFGEPGRSNTGPTNVHVNNNSIATNPSFGLYNQSTALTDGTCNWWGAADGPGGQGPGSGDAVSTKVTFSPFKGSEAAQCPEPTNVVVKPDTMRGWVFVNEVTNLPEQGTFVAGPAGQPKGDGSVQFTAATAPENHSILTNTYAGTPLSSITDLDYWTNQPGPTLAVVLRFDVKYRPSDTAYGGRLVFEPYQQTGTVGAGWQHWDALDGVGPDGARQGLWWASKTNAQGSNGACIQASPCTWAQILALFPDATLDNPASTGNGNLVLGVGSSWSGFVGQADALTVGIPGSLKTFDFEAPAASDVVVSPPDLNGWAFVNEQTNAIDDGTFVTGPAGQPKGVGSGELSTPTAPETYSYLTNNHAGTPLSKITALDYWTNQPGPTLAISLKFDIKYRPGDTAYGGRLVFEPYQQGDPVGAGWQHWDALDSTGATGARGGKWWASKTNAAGSNGLCPQASPCTWAEVLAAFPSARMDNPASLGNGNLVLGAGSGWAGFVGHTDALTIGIDSANTTYDLEPAVVPGAPTGVATTRGDESADVSFTPPVDDGGDPSLTYTATCTASGHTTRTGTGSSPITVNNLDNGTEYSCTVVATNAAGDGPASDAATVTPATVPGKPTAVDAVRGNAEAVVSFTAPGSDGGDAITDYTATCSASGHTTRTATGAGSPLTVTTLDNGTQYSCTVHATNTVGDGAESDGDDVTPATLPGAPTGTSATAGNQSASVAFTAPVDDGGAAITEYTATCSSGDPGTFPTRTATGASSPIVVTNLSNPIQYVCWVFATNAVGNGPNSNFAFVTPADPPGAPTGVLATAGDTESTLTWVAPVDDGGAPITGYTVTATPGGQTCTWTTGPLTCTVTGLDNGTDYTFAVTATNSPGTSDPSSASNQVTPFQWEGHFTPLVPSRILDSRFGNGRTGAVGPGESFDLQVSGRGGVPATGVSAVVINVTATNPTAPSFLTVWPTGVDQPLASNLNFVAGQTVPNLVTVKVGTGGQISIFNVAGSVHVVGDVVGWYSDSTVTGGSRLQPLVPDRILDTRSGNGHVGRIGPGESFDLQVTGRGGVPADGVSAVVMNVTVTNPTAPSFLTVFPSGVTRPLSSNLNFVAGQTVPNLVTVKVGTGGAVSFFNGDGSTDVVGDVVGWYSETSVTGGTRLRALVPSRILDTRNGNGHTGVVGAGETIDLQVTGRGGVPADGVSAVVLNVTVTNPSAPSFLTVWPSGVVRPLASNLNFVAGQTVPNLVVAQVGAGGQVSIFNVTGTTNVVADVVGWFRSTPP